MKRLYNRTFAMTALSVSALLLVSACGNELDEENEAAGTNDEANNAEEAEGNGNADNADAESEGFPVTVTDSAGEEVTIDEEPEAIASLLPSSTEILYDLGVGDKLVGVSEFCNYPQEAAEIETIGAQEIDAERILSLEPDVLFIQNYHQDNYGDMIDEFNDAGIETLVVEGAGSFDEAYDAIETIGEATGTEDEAAETVADMQARMNELAEKADDEIGDEDMVDVWVEVAPSPDIFTVGQETFMHEMLETINAQNAAEEHEGWVDLTEEEMVSLDPDVIITTYGSYVEDPVEEVTSRDGWESIPAVENERIYSVDEDVVSRPGPRLVEGAEALAEKIYPDVFE
ncbi:ABC transporter substrate-binding protein [Salisediminibacterium halotolerans]|uniref:Iron complex transport system substrate-binding protein n=1 Tax=Salisediminibacterium halotolerans TaxID=517425 RepID=A0A1H9UM65_9BACI|nr:ABC transporter substrate-binding protein [Salisediminibacterium haloalkalitolerans]SES10546.1 iron complex transport system substrate-binding protein [Salisediminibacterium haloalkalitolerans]